MTGDDLRAIITSGTDLINPRLSEIDWEAAAKQITADTIDAEHLLEALEALAEAVDYMPTSRVSDVSRRDRWETALTYGRKALAALDAKVEETP